MEGVPVSPREVLNATASTEPTGQTESLESWLAQYWYVLLIVLAVLVVLCVLVCACILRNKSRNGNGGIIPAGSGLHRSNHVIPPGADNGYSSSQQSSLPTMPSISGDSTPIPSPNSSQHSVHPYNSQGGVVNGRVVRVSPRLSSTSSDTLRPGAYSVSSNSSASLLRGGGASPNRNSPMERQGSLSRRTRSAVPMVRVTSMPDVKEGMRPAGSCVSVESSGSGRTGVSYRVHPNIDNEAVVEVGVTVHTPGDPDKASRIATAAAIAESARKLAQEAASFIDDEAERDHYRVGGAYYSRPGSGRTVSSMSRYPLTYQHHYKGRVGGERGVAREYDRYNSYHVPHHYEYHYPDSVSYHPDSIPYHHRNLEPYPISREPESEIREPDPYFSDTDHYYDVRPHHYSYRHGNPSTRRSSDTGIQYRRDQFGKNTDRRTETRTDEDKTRSRSAGKPEERLAESVDSAETRREERERESEDEGREEEEEERIEMRTREEEDNSNSSLESEESVEPIPPSPHSTSKQYKTKQLRPYYTSPTITPHRTEYPYYDRSRHHQYFSRQNSFPRLRSGDRYHHGVIVGAPGRERGPPLTRQTHLPLPVSSTPPLNVTIDV